MNYNTIMHDDMRNGEGLRVVLFVSGCSHNCKNCHNPQTHDPCSGKKFDNDALNEIHKYLDRDYTDGITLSGGDPLFEDNLDTIYNLVMHFREKYPNKTIWLYTGYTYEEIIKDPVRYKIVSLCDVLVEGRFVESLADVKYRWAGSTNQRVIDMKKTISNGEICLLS